MADQVSSYRFWGIFLFFIFSWLAANSLYYLLIPKLIFGGRHIQIPV